MSPGFNTLQLFLNAVPDNLHGRATALACNHLLQGQALSRRLKVLDGKRLWLTILDTDTRLQYRFQNGQLRYDASRNKPDIHVRGELKYLLQLASRNEDADTLFFGRQLSMEGNTEDGLILKNFLDALEFDTEAHLKTWLGAFVAQRAVTALKLVQPGKRLQQLITRLV
jgi:predicted lipid carrier protein YhbT